MRFSWILGSILEAFWDAFSHVFGVVFLSVFWDAFLEPKRAMTDPIGVILGPPGRGKGRGKPPPQSKNVAKAKCYFLLLCFLLRPRF